MARTVWGAHTRYMDTYLNVYKGYYVSSPVCGVRSQFLTMDTVHWGWSWSGSRGLLLDPWSR